jgi:hypothetical protein
MYRKLTKGGNAMAKLFLADAEVTGERLLEVLSERLSTRYKVYGGTGPYNKPWSKVEKDVFMAIGVAVEGREIGDRRGTRFITAYEPGLTATLILLVLIIPALLFLRWAKSPARRELEADVIEAIRNEWPAVTAQE